MESNSFYYIWIVIDRGDEVVLFDPSYETYEGCITMAGGIPVCFLQRITTGLGSIFYINLVLMVSK